MSVGVTENTGRSLFITPFFLTLQYTPVETWWHAVTHGRGSEGGNWRKEWVASTLHTTSEHGVSSITTADTRTSAASSRLNWRPGRFKRTCPFRRKTKFGFFACAITFQTQYNFQLLLAVAFLHQRTCQMEIQHSETSTPISCFKKWNKSKTQTHCSNSMFDFRLLQRRRW